MKRREFIKNTNIGIVAISGLPLGFDIFNSENNKPKNATIKDKLWLWGQNAGSHHENNNFGLPGVNHMEPKEGCHFLGIEKCLRVAMGSFGPFPPLEEEAKKLVDLKEVVWSAIGAVSGRYNNDQSELDEVLNIAENYPNISGAILDDFFHDVEVEGKISAQHSINSIRNMADKLHNFSKRRLDLWVVWYNQQLDLHISDYLELFDVITMWTWKGSDLLNIDSTIQKFVEKTPGKRHLVGVYMWNYGEKKPMTTDQMKYQLDRCHYWLKKEKIDGLIFCSNAIADLGLDAVEYTRKWITEVGNERI